MSELKIERVGEGFIRWDGAIWERGLAQNDGVCVISDLRFKQGTDIYRPMGARSKKKYQRVAAATFDRLCPTYKPEIIRDGSFETRAMSDVIRESQTLRISLPEIIKTGGWEFADHGLRRPVNKRKRRKA